MGNSQPTNKTNKKVTAQVRCWRHCWGPVFCFHSPLFARKKFDSAKKIGVLSLSEHGLDRVPSQLWDESELRKLRTLDLSKNKLTSIGKIGLLKELKSLNLDGNNFYAGSLEQIAQLSKLQNLSLAGNKLGLLPPHDPAQQTVTRSMQDTLPELPATLKQLNLSANALSHIPRPVFAVNLTKLEKLDLSYNQLATVPIEIVNLKNLEELNCDSNMIVSLSEELGGLKKLKVLSLRNNKLSVHSTIFSDRNPQPLPRSIFTDTLLIDLNLHGNQMTSTHMNQFDGYQQFLDRRQKVKSKTMTNLDVCGLD